MPERIEAIEILVTIRGDDGRTRTRRITSEGWPLRAVQYEESPIAVTVQGRFGQRRIGKVISLLAKWSEYP
ncbi:MAG TPA: hypothetical protein DFS52_04630 [Myxococcales bacterium]|jgi:hypothetical protein|nr:hypothetical protein [Myxococcales bacterium]